MKLLLTAILSILVGTPTLAAPVSRQSKESAQAFVERVTHFKLADDGYGHFQIAETSKLLKNQDLLIAFTLEPYDIDDKSAADDFDVHLQVFVKKSSTAYESLESAMACEVEGGNAVVRSFFFVNLREESNPVVAAICHWPDHPAADCRGSDEVRFFRVTSKDVSPIPMEKYKELFYVEKKPEPKAEFNCTYAKFKDAKDVKALLH